MNADAHPKRKDDILKQVTDETVVLLNLKDGQYYALNEVGGPGVGAVRRLENLERHRHRALQ